MARSTGISLLCVDPNTVESVGDLPVFRMALCTLILISKPLLVFSARQGSYRLRWVALCALARCEVVALGDLCLQHSILLLRRCVLVMALCTTTRIDCVHVLAHIT